MHGSSLIIIDQCGPCRDEYRPYPYEIPKPFGGEHWTSITSWWTGMPGWFENRIEPDIPSHKIQMPLLVTSPKSSWPLLEVDFPKNMLLWKLPMLGELSFVRSQQAAKVKPWTQHSWPKNLRKMPGKWEEKIGKKWLDLFGDFCWVVPCYSSFLAEKRHLGSQMFGAEGQRSSAAYFSGAAPGKRNDWCSNWI